MKNMGPVVLDVHVLLGSFHWRMRLRASPVMDNPDDLDLPPLDGEDEEETDALSDGDSEIDEPKDAGDAFDDATAEDSTFSPDDLSAAQGAEGGWLVDSDDAKTLDVGTFDLGTD